MLWQAGALHHGTSSIATSSPCAACAAQTVRVPDGLARQHTLMNSFCTSHTAPHWSLLLVQNSHSTMSALGRASTQSMTTMTSSWPTSTFLVKSFRASPALLVTKAAGMVMFLRYLQMKANSKPAQASVHCTDLKQSIWLCGWGAAFLRLAQH